MDTPFTTHLFDMYGEDKFEQLLAELCIEASDELNVLDVEIGGSERQEDKHDSICVGTTPAGRNVWVDESTRERSFTANCFKLTGQGFNVSGYIKPIEVASMSGFLVGDAITDIIDRTTHTNALVQAIRAKVEGR